MTGIRLAISYGTVHTVAVLEWPDGRRQALTFEGVPQLPSAVFAGADGHLTTGWDAVRAAEQNPAALLPYPRRHLGQSEVSVGDRILAATEPVTATLAQVAAEARRASGGAVIVQLVLPHPIGWDEEQRTALATAAVAAGLPSPFLIARPVAVAGLVAALSDQPASPSQPGPQHQPAPPEPPDPPGSPDQSAQPDPPRQAPPRGRTVPVGGSVLVYHLGGGSFEACVVRRDAPGVRPLAHQSLAEFGGIELDTVLLDRLAAAEPTEQWQQPRDQRTPQAYRLIDQVRAAREALSRDDAAAVPLGERERAVTREEFDEAAEPDLRRTVELTMATVAQARVSPADVTVVLMGGASRTPLAARLLYQATGLDPILFDPREIGAAWGALIVVPAPSTPPPWTTSNAVPTPPVPPPAGADRAVPPAAEPVPTGQVPAAPPLGPMPAGPTPTGPPATASADTEPAPPGPVPTGPVPAGQMGTGQVPADGQAAPVAMRIRPAWEPTPTGAPMSGPWPPAGAMPPAHPVQLGRRARRPIPRRWLVLGLVAVLLVCGGTSVAGALAWHSARTSAPAITRAAAAELQTTPAVRLRATYLDVDGRSVSGAFTVTGEGFATGTITDPVVGKADYRAGPETSAVRGDADWWARRTPKRVSGLAGTWVRPDSGVAFPVPVSSAFTPGALADLVRAVGEHGTSDGTVDTVDGHRVVTVTSGGWTMLLTDASPRRVVALVGPVRGGRLTRPAVATGVPGRLVPAQLGGGPSGYELVKDDADDPYIEIAPEPADKGDAAKARQEAGQVVPDGPSAGASGTPSAGPSPSASTAPPAAADVPVPKPDLQAKLTPGGGCSTSTCPVSGTVTNEGTATCENAQATIKTSIAGSATKALGAIAPGQTKSASATFPNPVPPGQTRSVHVDITATCTSEVKTDPAVDKRLKARGINPDRSPVLNSVDPKYRQTVRTALDQMTRGLPADKTPKTKEAINDAVTAIASANAKGLLPVLKTLVDNKDRVLNWGDLAEKLRWASQDTDSSPGATEQPPANQIGYRRELERAATVLRQDPRTTVIVDGAFLKPDGKPYRTTHVDPQTGEKTPVRCGADLFDMANKRAYQIKSVSTNNLGKRVNEAANQLNGKGGKNGLTGPAGDRIKECVPPGFTKIVYINIEVMHAAQYEQSREELTRYLNKFRKNMNLCPGGKPAVDELVIANKTGEHRWTKDQFREFNPACTE